jgi:DNA-binding NarL/FixJ family response regulator
LSTFTPCEVIEATSGEQAVEEYEETQPDITIMDINMQGMSGIEAGRIILERDSAAKILCFSMHEETAVASHAMNVGIRGYITKSSTPDTLIKAVRKVMAGEVFLQDELSERLAPEMIIKRDSRFNSMTSREYEIFLLLANGRNTDEIAKELSISQKTISNYITILKNKLEITSAAQLVHLAADAGLIHSARKKDNQEETSWYLSTALVLPKD